MSDNATAELVRPTQTRLQVLQTTPKFLEETYAYGSDVQPPNQYRPKPVPKVKSRPNKINAKYTVYKCPELRQTCFRAGAYDAFELPSIFGSERRPYRISQDQK